MNDDFQISSGMPLDDMATYLQMYLDETAEQLDTLTDTLLLLEGDPTNHNSLNEAFRLIHSIKGSSAMMGLDSITVLTHHLENHFERLRSGLRTLDQSMMDLILRCIDFLRLCNQRLRDGQALASAPELLEELSLLNQTPAAPRPTSSAPESPKVSASIQTEAAVSMLPSSKPINPPPAAMLQPAIQHIRILLRFSAEMQLPDLKAELILSRLAEVGTIIATKPTLDNLGLVCDDRELQILIDSSQSVEELRAIANIGGVELLNLELGVNELLTTVSKPTAIRDVVESAPAATPGIPQHEHEDETPETTVVPAKAEVSDAADTKTKVGETVRVDIERLDNLMNLAGELVVNKARFTQLAREMSPAFKKSNVSTRARAFGEMMRSVIQLLKTSGENVTQEERLSWSDHLLQMESEIELLDDQAKQWDESRRYFGQIVEAIDQLTRVSNSLQRGVLDTRMVPVAPLFNRFKRVVRDISHEMKKKIVLEIHGENTELDKRMIDELGDPLVHLVRNAIDHGIESADVRLKRGKPETGTVVLEASHSGNNVFITVRDDGGGINVDKVRQRLIDRELISAATAELLSEREIIDYIWHPGFSTADVVSDISGRGVGMDIVKTRIAELNGIIDIDHTPGHGTCFTIRLPLTLAIIRSLLFRLKHGVFAVPIDNVREIVSVPIDQVVNVHGKKTFEVRGEFIPLVDIDDIFDWHNIDYDSRPQRKTAHHRREQTLAEGKRVDVVILHNANKALGLKVDELHGGQDIVIKSLAENFVHIRGLSGASILGDGSVCLLLDVGAVIEMAIDPERKSKTLERHLHSV